MDERDDRAMEMSASVEIASLTVLRARGDLLLSATSDGHALGDLRWEHRRGPSSERWDLVTTDGAWVGGITADIEPDELVIREAVGPPGS